MVVSNAPYTGTWTDVAIGSGRACAVAAEGGVTCWGDDEFGLASEAPGTGSYVEVVMTYGDACARDDDGQVACWPSVSQLPGAVPPGLVATQLAAGEVHVLALDASGAITAFGMEYQGEVSGTPTSTGWTGIGAGDGVSCAIDAGGELSCWGRTEMGLTNPPAGVFTSIGTGVGSVLCAIREDQRGLCWGGGAEGATTPPTDVLFRQLVGGSQASCGIDTDGAIHCFGSDSYGLVSAAPSST